MDSILQTVKKVAGVEDTFTGFDDEIILGINTAFMSLTQLGVGPDTGFSIVDDSAVWTDFLGAATDIEGVKSYICLKVRLAFDPPTVSFMLEAINRQISELEWRLALQVEPPIA